MDLDQEVYRRAIGIKGARADFIPGAAMHDGSDNRIAKITMDTSTVPEPGQFAYWAAHTHGAHLSQPVPGPFLCQGDMWNLGALQAALVVCDPFIAIRDRALVNANDADYIQFVQLLEGDMTFEAEGRLSTLTAPASFIRDASRPSNVTATRTRMLLLYVARGFLEEATGPIDYQGPLDSVPELELLRAVATEMIRFFPHARASGAPLYATILRDLAAAAMRRAGAGQRADRLPLLAAAKAYFAAQPPGTLSVTETTAALGISRSVLYRLFEREGGLLAYDRMRRLRAAHRAMANPLNTSSLAELASRYGFRNQAALLRSFRKAFGYSPSELRQRHAITPAMPAIRTASDEIRQAFDAID